MAYSNPAPLVMLKASVERIQRFNSTAGSRVLPGLLTCGYFAPRLSARVWLANIVNGLRG